MAFNKKKFLKVVVPIIAGTVLVGGSSYYLTNKAAVNRYTPEIEFLELRLNSANAELARFTTGKQAFVLVRDKAAGEKITPDDLTAVEVPESFAPLTIINQTAIVGKLLKIDAKANTMVVSDMLYMDGPIEDTARRLEIGYARLPIRMKVTDQIDINIVFPNGETYTVLSKKRMDGVDFTSGTLFLRANYEEQLLLHSAYVDSYIWSGEIYVSQYVAPELQKGISKTYMPNKDVLRQLNVSMYVDEEAKSKYQAVDILRSGLEERLEAITESGRSLRVGGAPSAGSGASNQTRTLGASIVPNNAVTNPAEVVPEETPPPQDGTVTLNPVYVDESEMVPEDIPLAPVEEEVIIDPVPEVPEVQ